MRVLVPLLVVLMFTTAHAEPRVNYVGSGRYACSGLAHECASTNQRNEELSRREAGRAEQNRQSEAVLNEQRRQTQALENIRNDLRSRR